MKRMINRIIIFIIIIIYRVCMIVSSDDGKVVSTLPQISFDDSNIFSTFQTNCL